MIDVRNGLVEKYSTIFGSGTHYHRMPVRSCRRGQLGRIGKNLVEEPEGAQFSLLMTAP